MGIFGWDLPPGCRVSDIPGNRQEDLLAEAISEGYRLTCRKCKAFLSFTPDRTEPWEDGWYCDGCSKYCENTVLHEPHKVIEMVGSRRFHLCKRCGTENMFDE